MVQLQKRYGLTNAFNNSYVASSSVGETSSNVKRICISISIYYEQKIWQKDVDVDDDNNNNNMNKDI